MTAFTTHFTFEFRTGIRNRSLLFLTYLFPLIFYLMMGFIMPSLNPMFLPGLVPAMVTFEYYLRRCWASPIRWSPRERPGSFAATRSTVYRQRRSCASQP